MCKSDLLEKSLNLETALKRKLINCNKDVRTERDKRYKTPEGLRNLLEKRKAINAIVTKIHNFNISLQTLDIFDIELSNLFYTEVYLFYINN